MLIQAESLKTYGTLLPVFMMVAIQYLFTRELNVFCMLRLALCCQTIKFIEITFALDL
jgi:hypothetical protein